MEIEMEEMKHCNDCHECFCTCLHGHISGLDLFSRDVFYAAAKE